MAESAFSEKLLADTINALQEQKNQSQAKLEEYQSLSKSLLAISKVSTKQVMIPLSSVGFLPGKLKHTNEVYVHYGSNYFVQRTAQECQPIIDRRVKQISDRIKYLDENLEKQTGVKNILDDFKMPKADSQPTTSASAEGNKSDRSIPTTHWNKDGLLEINEAYHSGSDDDDDNDNTAPQQLKKAPTKPVTDFETKFDYVDDPFSFSQVKNPADLRKAMTSQRKVEEKKVAQQTIRMSAQPTNAVAEKESEQREVERAVDQLQQQIKEESFVLTPSIVERDPLAQQQEASDSKPKKLSRFAQMRLEREQQNNQ